MLSKLRLAMFLLPLFSQLACDRNSNSLYEEPADSIPLEPSLLDSMNSTDWWTMDSIQDLLITDSGSIL